MTEEKKAASPQPSPSREREAIIDPLLQKREWPEGPGEASALPRVMLKPGEDKRLKRGHLWIFSNEIAAFPAGLVPGATVSFQTGRGEFLGTGFLNSKSLIAGRVLSRRAVTPDAAFFEKALLEARGAREAIFPDKTYRWVFGESDELPGLVIDRYDDVCVVESYCAGMDVLMPQILEALEKCGPWRGVVLKNDVAPRALEGLAMNVSVARGDVPRPHEFTVDGLRLLADPVGGQKTGFYLDQRENRRALARLCAGKTVLDVFCHTGGFGLWAAQAGAVRVRGVDQSKEALELARANAQNNGLDGKMTFEPVDAFSWLAEHKDLYDVVVIDPPNICPSKKQLPKALAALESLVKSAAARVQKGGILAVAVCSHHIDRQDMRQAIARGVSHTKRLVRQIHASGAAADHPVRPSMPETDYLKFVIMTLS
jgi:23S rRNA (cytosine1962-C5)-methyltransferase